MTQAAFDLWTRSVEALRVARHDLAMSPDASASRAYYAAFYAVSAELVARGMSFSKHSAVEAAVHRDLVRVGLWSVDLGRAYSRLVQLRSRADYGGSRHVTPDDARESVKAAEDIVRAIAAGRPELFVAPTS